MNKYPYPYINDKKMYAAVRYACKMIRETGYQNKSISIAARTYGLEEEKIRAEVNKRRIAGQKAKYKPRKFNWYVVATLECSDACGVGYILEIATTKATCKEKTHNHSRDWQRIERERDYGGAYAPYFVDKVIFEGETKKEAEAKRQEVMKILGQMGESGRSEWVWENSF